MTTALPESSVPEHHDDGRARSVEQPDAGHQEDEVFCERLLGQVSRTFVLSIQGLPREVGVPVRIAYLLCRIVDTIEDDEQLTYTARQDLFSRFERVLDGHAEASDLEHAARQANLGNTAAERELCTKATRVFRRFRSLPDALQASIRSRVLEMVRGMRYFAARKDREGRLHLVDLSELERYCYFVAGTVGHLLTDTFLASVPELLLETRRELARRAEPFGIGLQLVNILKDLSQDHESGRCFIPRSLCREYAVDPHELLSPAQRPRGLQVVASLCRLAHEHLRAARAYTLLWPATECSHIRRFCVLPLGLALGTLAEIERGHDTLMAGRSPKVSRGFVSELMARTDRSILDDASLLQLLDDCYSTLPSIA